jgi:hypothetical protein
VGVYTTPAKLAMGQRARFALANGDMKIIHGQLANLGKKEFKNQTLGPLSSKTLRRMGHPYAKLGVSVSGAARGITSKKKYQSSLKGQVKRNGMVSRLPINKQSGRLNAAIRLSGPSGPQNTYKLASYAPHAGFALKVGGTKHVVDRGLLGPKGRLRRVHLIYRHTAIDVVKKAHRRF